jgi:hypothetical protein
MPGAARVLFSSLAVIFALNVEASAGQKPAPDSVVIRWNEALLQGVRDTRLGPPMAARALAIAHTCMYDAWAAYDKEAVGTRLGATLRRPANERKLAYKREAISYAAYRAAKDLFPADADLFTDLITALGYDPDDASTDTTTPVGIGNVACAAVLDFRHHDGANQLGDEPGGRPGVPYSDYTAYAPVNRPMDIRTAFDAATVLDPSRWQPLIYENAAGAVVQPPFTAPHWQHVIPFALTSADQFRAPIGPASYGSAQFVEQARDLLAISANLTDEQKVIAEYWADGAGSETPPGHWNLFAQLVARRDRHGAKERGVDQDVKMFFALTNAIFDASIVAWDDKRAFDSVRPITAIRFLFEGQTVTAWGGPFQGTRQFDGADWFPYQPRTFPTPPFAEHCSGHSTFSAAGARILELFTGSDSFGGSVTIPAGSSAVEPGATPAQDVALHWPTFLDAANQAGISRRYGGIHFEQGDLDGRAAGRQLADQAWAEATRYFAGKAVH